MARTKQTNGKRVTSRKALAGKAPRKTLGGKGRVPAIAQKRKYRFRPGSQLISKNISISTNWIYS
jgi:hypothetical protein